MKNLILACLLLQAASVFPQHEHHEKIFTLSMSDTTGIIQKLYKAGFNKIAFDKCICFGKFSKDSLFQNGKAYVLDMLDTNHQACKVIIFLGQDAIRPLFTSGLTFKNMYIWQDRQGWMRTFEDYYFHPKLNSLAFK